jgi:ribosome-binding factor A
MKQTAASRKLNEAARAALASIMLFQVSDPRLDMVTVTEVEVSRDRSVANVYVASTPGTYDDVMAGLESAKGRIRSLLGAQLEWRVTPELRFFIDESIDEASKIEAVLQEGNHAND